MKLVLTYSRIKLLLYVGAGKVALDENGEAVLVVDQRKRKVTIDMDRFEQFGLVHATIQDRTYTLTERGKEAMNKAVLGGV